jgi:hypothetical protein
MIVKDAIDFILNSAEFKEVIKKLPENGAFCRELNVKLLADVPKKMYYCEVYFDYGNAGNSLDDILARAACHDDGAFSLLYIGAI